MPPDTPLTKRIYTRPCFLDALAGPGSLRIASPKFIDMSSPIPHMHSFRIFRKDSERVSQAPDL